VTGVPQHEPHEPHEPHAAHELQVPHVLHGAAQVAQPAGSMATRETGTYGGTYVVRWANQFCG